MHYDAFMPEPAAKTGRADGCGEASVNWEDDDRAVAVTLSDASGEYGAARVPRQAIVVASQVVVGQNNLIGERNTRPRNPYHGNLVFPAGLNRRIQKAVADCLSVNADRIYPAEPPAPK